MNKDQEVTRYIEKPGWNEVVSNVVNTGIYIMEPEVFSYIPPIGNFDFSHDVSVIGKQKCYSHICQKVMVNIGTFNQYRQAQFDLLTKKLQVPIPYTEVLPMVWMGERGDDWCKGRKFMAPLY